MDKDMTQGRGWAVIAAKGVELLTKLTIIGLPLLYLLGWAYMESFWRVFGLHDELLAYTTSELVRAGTLMLLTSFTDLVDLSLILGLGVFALAATLVVWATRARLIGPLSKCIGNKRAERNASEPFDPKEQRVAALLDRGMDAILGGVLSILSLLLAGMLLVWITLVPATSLGEREATTGMQKLQSAIGTNGKFVLAGLASDHRRMALLIRCSAAQCALFDGAGVVLVARSEIYAFQPCFQVERGEEGDLHCGKG